MATARLLLQACAMQCHACQSEIPLATGESVGFRDACDRCRADLHVCLCCAHHDPASYNECREPGADRVLDKDRANRCEWFRPASGPATGDEIRRTVLADLESLFKKG
ncbi:MAG: hypothetical protein R3F16_09705 [Myxococcota bacterium]|nr:hypothetical protein [Myxococcales bacterium]